MVLAEYHQNTLKWQMANICFDNHVLILWYSAKTMFTPTMFSRRRTVERNESYVCVYVYVYVYIYIYMYVYIHIHIHMFICMYHY